MKIKVKVYKTYDSDSKMKAMCNVRIDDTFSINGVKLIQGNNGYFIGMPQYTDKNGKTHHQDFDCPSCDGWGFFKRNLRKCYEPEDDAIIELEGFFINNKHIKAIIDALFLLGKDHITLLSKAKKDSVVWAYFRIDENITIIVAPYRYCDDGKADTKVEL